MTTKQIEIGREIDQKLGRKLAEAGFGTLESMEAAKNGSLLNQNSISKK